MQASFKCILIYSCRCTIFFLYIKCWLGGQPLPLSGSLVFVEGGIISGSDAVHIKALVVPRVLVYCIGKKQLSFLGGLKL